jgi:sugar fermentation stimulation protein
MKISDKPLKRGKLIKRYKRFLTDVELDDGGGVTATCPNTGSMMGLLDEGNPVWLSVSDNPKRKYAHTWEMVEAVNAAGAAARVGLNTGLPNKLVEEAILAGKVDALTGYESLKREQKYGKNSRIDILLSNEDRAGLLCRGEERDPVARRRHCRVSRRRDGARRQAPGGTGGHGARRPPGGDGVPRPALRR